MIAIAKTTTAPTRLTKEGTIKAAAHSAEYLDNSTDLQSGQKSFSFAKNIYNHSTVKNALLAAQHHKCCFCERLIAKDGQVEHFRPIDGYAQKLAQGVLPMANRPGYYWLAYDWDNLYLSCTACKNCRRPYFFPISDPAQRAQLQGNDINSEDPLLIDPGKDEPSEHLSFRGEIPYGVDGSKKGKTTIQNLQLDRATLNDARLRHLQIMKSLDQVIQMATATPENQALQALAVQATAILAAAVADLAEFAEATRQALATNFEQVL
jgi:uncharacterized protein (TIGR02646 family)